jgi:hypothetical protein
MNDNPILEKPFDNIAIAFSGGGFRAATFALGTLCYLERIGLTNQINYVSSASGGTITNLLYTSCLKQGIPFDVFYEKALAALNGEQLLTEVLTLLNDDKQWQEQDSGKERNLINSFARVYDSKLLFDGQTLSVFWNDNRKGLEICANTTEFYRGLSFRFQTDGIDSSKELTGNFYLHFDVNEHLETLKKIKLADVLASSSCFPAGFEPICYPCDFSHTNLSIDELRQAMLYTGYDEIQHPLSFVAPPHEHDPKQQNYIDSFGFMDGGVTDNQGLASLMLADNERRFDPNPNTSPFDLMIITDVASYFMDSYVAPEIKQPVGWRGKTISFFENAAKKVVSYPTTIMVVSLLAIIACIVICLIEPNITKTVWCCTFAGFFAAFLLLSIIVKTNNPTKKIIAGVKGFSLEQELIVAAKMKNIFSAPIISKLTQFLSLTKLNVFEQMLKARISSMLSMVMDVNLKQVRRLIYQSFYANINYENRRMPNFIYELCLHNAASRTNRINDPKRLTWTATDADKALLLGDLQLIQPIAENARLMGTTLWFEDNDQGKQLMKDVVATGQFTTCMNLVEYVISLQRKNVQLNPQASQKVNNLMAQLLKDLDEFKKDPYCMYDGRMPAIS